MADLRDGRLGCMADFRDGECNGEADSVINLLMRYYVSDRL